MLINAGRSATACVVVGLLSGGSSLTAGQIAEGPAVVGGVTVTVSGAGAPVVIIPGLFGSAYSFRKVAPELAALGFRVIIVEPLGMGTSSRPSHADYSLTAQAERVAAVLDSLGVRAAIVVPHSLSGGIAFRLAWKRPDLVRAIVAIEAGPGEAAAPPGLRKAMKFAPLIRLAGRGALRSRVRRSLLSSSGDTSWVTDDAVAHYTDAATADLGATVRVYRAMGEAREPEPLAPNLGVITCPVTLLLGDAAHDGRPPAAELRALRDALPALEVQTVAGAGHYIQEEQPDVVVAAIAHQSAATAEAGSADATSLTGQSRSATGREGGRVLSQQDPPLTKRVVQARVMMTSR